MHLMRWQQLFPQIFLCSYPFPLRLKSIFVVGVSWKVVQGKTKLTLLTYVRSEEDDPLGQTPLGIYLLYYLLRGLFPCFLLLRHIVIKKWDFKPNADAQVLTPTIIIIIIGQVEDVSCSQLTRHLDICHLSFAHRTNTTIDSSDRHSMASIILVLQLFMLRLSL